MGENKTEFAYEIALNIVKSKKDLPLKLVELFNEIKKNLNLKLE
jgi:DNA-directed RNA polymerase delta subunit